MATLTVEGKQFDLDTLTDEAKAIASAISFTDAKIKQTEQELMMSRAARTYYVSELLKVLPQENETKKQPAKKTTTRKRAPAKTASKTSSATKASTRKTSTTKS